MATAARSRLVNDIAVRGPGNIYRSVLSTGSGSDLLSAVHIRLRRDPNMRSCLVLKCDQSSGIRCQTHAEIVVEVIGDSLGLTTRIREAPYLNREGWLLSSNHDQAAAIRQPFNT